MSRIDEIPQHSAARCASYSLQPFTSYQFMLQLSMNSPATRVFLSCFIAGQQDVPTESIDIFSVLPD